MNKKLAMQLTAGDRTPYGTVAGIYPWNLNGKSVLTLEFTDSFSQTRFPLEAVEVY